MSGPKLGVLASGRGSNLAAILEASSQGELPGVALVLSDVPGCLALEKAQAAGVATLALDAKRFATRLAFEEELRSALGRAGVGLVCLAGYMKILGQPLLEGYAGRILNIHPSLLPAFPGLHAQRQALQRGVRVSGCTVHFVDAGTDTGPIVGQTAVPVLPRDTEETLSARILAQEHRLYPRAIRWVAEGRVRQEPGNPVAVWTGGQGGPPPGASLSSPDLEL
jgi:phosphoribosylglycinamide formyltransferase-1